MGTCSPERGEGAWIAGGGEVFKTRSGSQEERASLCSWRGGSGSTANPPGSREKEIPQQPEWEGGDRVRKRRRGTSQGAQAAVHDGGVDRRAPSVRGFHSVSYPVRLGGALVGERDQGEWP